MLSQATLLGLIGRIYDTAADESLWPTFLEELAGALDSAYYSTFDPYRSASRARLTRIGPESVYVGEQLIEPSQLHKTEFYNDFLAAHDMVHHMCAPLSHEKRWASNLSCHRPAGKHPFGADELNLLRRLFPTSSARYSFTGDLRN